MSSLASAAAAFDADKIADMPTDEAIRKLSFEVLRLRNEHVDMRAEVRRLRCRVDRLEGIKATCK